MIQRNCKNGRGRIFVMNGTGPETNEWMKAYPDGCHNVARWSRDPETGMPAVTIGPEEKRDGDEFATLSDSDLVTMAGELGYSQQQTDTRETIVQQIVTRRKKRK